MECAWEDIESINSSEGGRRGGRDRVEKEMKSPEYFKRKNLGEM